MSDPIHVLITLPFSELILAKLRAVSPSLRIWSIRARKPEEVPQDVWSQVDILYTNRVLPTAEMAPNLNWIQFHWAGIDHAIDEPILKKPDLVATTLSGAASSQMAEYILTMLLALGHNLPDIIAHQKRGEWPKDRWERFSPRELRGSTVGIVGYGSIGRQVARLLQPFGVHVLATKRDAMHPEDLGYTPEGWGDQTGELAERIYPPQAIRSMVRECDFVVITVPLTAETRNLINADVLGVFKPGAYLVDVSRGGVVDQVALHIALRDRKFAGAAVDVFPEEPLPEDSPLWKLSNIIITPHISGNTPYYDDRAADLFAENLRRYLAGLPLLNRFDLEHGY